MARLRTDEQGVRGRYGQVAINDERMAELVKAVADVSASRGLDPRDVLTVMGYETGGTYHPSVYGPVTQWGQHKGLIQWGVPQARQYGVDMSVNAIRDQVSKAGQFMVDNGVIPGDNLTAVYGAVNAGKALNPEKTDARNHGAPGTVLDKVNDQMKEELAAANSLYSRFGPNPSTMNRYGVGFSVTPGKRAIEKTSPQKPASNPVADLQVQLKELGLYNGPIDGRKNRETRLAYMDFQKSRGLNVGMNVNQAATRQMLRDEYNARMDTRQRGWGALPPPLAQSMVRPTAPAVGGMPRNPFFPNSVAVPTPRSSVAPPLNPAEVARMRDNLASKMAFARPNPSNMNISGYGFSTPSKPSPERLARSPISGQRARLSEIASMQALDAYRNEPRIVATPPFSGVGRMPMPGEGERLARSPIIGQQARASEIKSMSDLAAMARQQAEQRAGLASQARASENQSMADLASAERKVAENRALYAPFARAAENKSMRDLASFRNESAISRASAARASERQSMQDLALMRTENLAVRTPPERAIGSLPAAPVAAVPSAGLAQGRRASENRSMQDLAMDRAGVFGPSPTAFASSNPQTMNFRSMAVSKAEDQVREAAKQNMSAAPTSDFRQTPASRLADAYGVYGRSRAQQAMPAAPIANDPRAAASLAGYVQGWGAKPGSIQTGAKMPMDAVMAPRQMQAPAQPPAVPAAQPPTIAYGTPSANRLSQAYTQYGNMRNAAQLAEPQVAAPAPQRQAPAVVPAQPRQAAPQISNEPQYSGRTPGDRARSAAFQPGGIFGYTSQIARGGGGYNPTPI